MNHIKIFLIAVFLLFLHYNVAFSQYYVRNTTVIDTPTAYTIPRGNYQLSFLGYDNGGVELKSFIGLHNNFYLGASLDIQNAIGKDDPEPNIPGVVGKIKFTDGWEMFPISFAIGYDSFYIGQEGKIEKDKDDINKILYGPYYFLMKLYNNESDDKDKLNRVIYGPYLVITKPIYLFNDEQHIHFGIRIPTQPEYVPEDSSYFLALDIPLGEMFVFKAEMERVYYNFKRVREWLYNVGMRYSYMHRLGIEFDILFQKGENPNRILRIEYMNEF